jgi:hypothetical protein
MVAQVFGSGTDRPRPETGASWVVDHFHTDLVAFHELDDALYMTSTNQKILSN